MKISKSRAIILSIIAFLEAFVILMLPFSIKYLVDVATHIAKNDSTYTMTSLWIVVGVTLGVVVIDVVLKCLEYILYSRFSLSLEREFRNKLYNSLIFKDSSKLHYTSAELEMLLSTDISNQIRIDLDIIPTLVSFITKILCSVVYLALIDYKFLLITLGVGIIGFVCAKVYSRFMKPLHRRVLENEAKLNSFTLESRAQIKIIHAYDAMNSCSKKYEALNDDSYNAKRKRNRVVYLAGSLMYGVSNIAFVFSLAYGALFIAIGSLTYGDLTALLQLVNNLKNPIISLSPLFNKYSQAAASRERINTALSLPAISSSSDDFEFDSIEFENVSFRYDEDNQVISNLTDSIKASSLCELKGPSGVGKTTLFMLLMGFIKPNSGRIYFKRGSEEIELSISTRSQFSYVPQENVLFSGTIIDNIKLLTEKDEAEIIEALKLSNVYDEIMILEKGLNTSLRERGSGLSLGQIQRVLIAIAILNDTRVLLLDEFSSALDINNERIIVNNLKKLGKTIIYITHKASQFETDKVIYLKKE